MGATKQQCAFSIPADDEQTLSAEETRRFFADGFLTLERIASEEEIAQIRRLLQTLLARRAGAREGRLFDTLAGESCSETPRSVQLTNPSHYARELRDTRFFQRAQKIAHSVLSTPPRLVADLLLFKPARCGLGTPWHQDEAFRDPGFVHREVTFWLPLQAVKVSDGCMVFLPGSQTIGVLQHHSPHDDPSVHALECSADIPEDTAVACELSLGSCTMHDSRVLHCTGDNSSPRDRYAYIIIFGEPPVRSHEKRRFPWLDARKTVDQQARRSWLLRGGIIVALLRKISRGDVWSLPSMQYSLRKGIATLRRRHSS